MLVQFPLFVVCDEMYVAAGRDKLGGRLATQYFSFSACKRHFGGQKYNILMFCTKIASIFEFIVIHAKISNVPLQFALNLALPLAHSRTFWLSLNQSGSLWLSLWFSEALIGSQGPCLALHVVDVWPHSLSQPVWRVKFLGQKLCIDCRMWLTLHGVVNVSVNQSVRLTLS